MKRVGLLAGVLVLVLGTGAVAQSSSPEATALYAPDDLATTLPTTVGDYEVRITSGTLPPAYREFYRDMLLPFGRTPDDVLGADGMGYPTGDEDALDRDGPSFDLRAMRVEGIPADVLVEPWVLGAFAASDAFDESLWQMGWRDIGGRAVYAATPVPEWWDEAVAREGANPEFGWYLLAKGEVMFVVSLPVSRPVSSPVWSRYSLNFPRNLRPNPNEAHRVPGIRPMAGTSASPATKNATGRGRSTPSTPARSRWSGKRSREWAAVGQTELHCVQEMARCLGELKVGRWPR